LNAIGDCDEEILTRILWCHRRSGGALWLPRSHTLAAVVRGDAHYVAGFNDDYIASECDHQHGASDDGADNDANVARPNYTYDAEHRTTDDDHCGANNDDRAFNDNAQRDGSFGELLLRRPLRGRHRDWFKDREGVAWLDQ
jgi:hypothetical protein